MKHKDIEVVKTSGEKVKFSLSKLRNSLIKSGADLSTVDQIVDSVRDDLYHGISTKKIYDRAFDLLRKRKSAYASRYKLKKAIYELGPTGYPFEILVGEIFKRMEYEVQIGRTYQGKCVSHEVDVSASKGRELIMIECKYHSDERRSCNVKVPLYIRSRYEDIRSFNKDNGDGSELPNVGLVATNTRFTEDAIQYGQCVGLGLLSWNYPNEDGIKEKIDKYGLYPITVLMSLSSEEKAFILSKDIILCYQLSQSTDVWGRAKISEARKKIILAEIEMLCQNQ